MLDSDTLVTKSPTVSCGIVYAAVCEISQCEEKNDRKNAVFFFFFCLISFKTLFCFVE